MNLYEMLKARKVGWSNDFFTNIYAKAFEGIQPASEHEYTGAVPYTFTADGTPLIDWYIKGQTVQSGTPTPTNPVDIVGVGTLDGDAYKLPIICGGTTTSINIGAVQSTRQIGKYEFTGQEDFTNAGGSIFIFYGLFNNNPFIPQSGAYCTHYNYNSAQSDYSTAMQNNDFVMPKQSDSYNIGIKDTRCSNKTEFRNFLQQKYANGTPVTVWYILSTAQTDTVNEPIMKIGAYADSITATQAGVDIPTANGSNTIEVSTMVKPSEIYIKWKG